MFTVDVKQQYNQCLLGPICPNIWNFRVNSKKIFICTGSETSSEHSAGSHSIGSESISSKNTLLASGLTRKLQLSKLEDTMKDMTLDANLLNPDLLWKRPESA